MICIIIISLLNMKSYLTVQENKINSFYNQNKHKFKNSDYSEQQIKGKLREIYCSGGGGIYTNRYIRSGKAKYLGLDKFKK